MSTENVGARLQQIAPEEFSGTISVGLCGGPHVTRAFGLAYRPEQIPNSERTRFGIASGTKGFTALAILRLIQQGHLRLETTLREVLPGIFPEHAGRITILHLLTHRAGIPDYCDEDAGCDFEALWQERPVYTMTRPQDFLSMFTHLPMESTPGKTFAYRNSGFIVLGLVVEAVSGIAYSDYVQAEVFHPLGMTRAGFFRTDMLPDDSAMGYIENPDGSWRSNMFAIPIIGAPDGGSYASASDMHAFWSGLFSGKYLEAELLDLLVRTELPTNSPRGYRYSLGFWVAPDWGNRRYLFLTGEDPGVSFVSGCCLETQVLFTVLANTGNGSSLVMRAVIDLLGEVGSDLRHD